MEPVAKGSHLTELERYHKSYIRGYQKKCVYADNYKSIFYVTYIPKGEDTPLIELVSVSTHGLGADANTDFKGESNFENQCALIKKFYEVARFIVKQ